MLIFLLCQVRLSLLLEVISCVSNSDRDTSYIHPAEGCICHDCIVTDIWEMSKSNLPGIADLRIDNLFWVEKITR